MDSDNRPPIKRGARIRLYDFLKLITVKSWKNCVKHIMLIVVKMSDRDVKLYLASFESYRSIIRLSKKY